MTNTGELSADKKTYMTTRDTYSTSTKDVAQYRADLKAAKEAATAALATHAAKMAEGNKARGSLTTSTPPTLILLLLHRDSVRATT